MSDLFGSDVQEATDARRPLADLLRPTRLDQIVGQDHLLGPEGVLLRLLASGRLPSMIVWGPPGVGKTSLARLLAGHGDMVFETVSAVASGVRELRTLFARAERAPGGMMLFVDEIHRFNRAQQDSFLPVVESGAVTLVGATTENPSFELIGPLLSRCRVLTMRRLSMPALGLLLGRAETHAGRPLPLTIDAKEALCAMADGDGRHVLTLAEEIFAAPCGDPPDRPLDRAGLSARLARRAPAYDKAGDAHYALISAVHKSIRASDPDAALYWLARMIQGGENALYIARRLIRVASEDIGLADPLALLVASEAARTYERLGPPEGELALAQAVVHLAGAPKSIAVYRAWSEACSCASSSGSLPPPAHLLNAPTSLMKEMGYGAGYAYDPDSPDGFSGQKCFPDGMEQHRFYRPTTQGAEAAIAERMAYWSRLRADNASDTMTSRALSSVCREHQHPKNAREK